MAAGEVIDSLGSVVRELVDNALDAQATRITIAVDPERWQVRVSDDGIGIPQRDLPSAALAHTTSKDPHLGSLGFRGEALHSMARLGSLHLQTWAQGDPHGWQAVYDREGTMQTLQPVALSRGTVVTLADLFANWPSRRETAMSGSRLIKSLAQIVGDAALIHPSVTWLLTVAGKEILRLATVPTMHARIPQLLRQVHLRDLRSGGEGNGLSHPPQDPAWQLVLGLPDRCHRPRPDWIKIAVNGRVVQVPEVMQIIQSAFHPLLPRHRHPVCVAHLWVPPDQVDWNRDPAKSELFVKNLEQHQASLEVAIRALLASTTGIPSSRAQGWIRASEQNQSYQTVSPPSFASLQVLAQLQNTYILAEHATGLWLIEQHVAHERVRYEQLCQSWRVVDLPQAVLLDNLSAEQVERLETLKLEPEPFGEGVWRVQKLPELFVDAGLLVDGEVNPDIHSPEGEPKQGSPGIPAWSEDLQALSRCDGLDAARITTACRTAIRNGIPLDRSQMQALVNAWANTAHPHTCPHGRPICLQLNEVDLARFFRRHWSICDQGTKGSLGSSPDLKLGNLFAREIRR